MGKGKLSKFADMATFPNVFQFHPLSPSREIGNDRMVCQPGDLAATLKKSSLWTRWEDLETAPLILELGCGRGEYTVGLARRFADKRFMGVDIKGARMWHGAQKALADGLTNAAFLRTNIEFIDRFFLPGEVSEIWLTFSDPQMKKPSKRLTSTNFLQRYRHIMPDGGLIHLKTDSQFLFTYTRELLRANSITPEVCIEDIHSSANATPLLREVRTYYEEMWIERGIAIKYLCFHLPAKGSLIEPDIELPIDEYRSYNRHKRSSKETAR